MFEVHDVDFIRPCGVVVFACVMVSVIVVVCICVFSYLCVCVVCLTVLVNCLLNAFAVCVGEVNVFSLKVFFFFLANPCMVFQTVCMLCV